MWQRGLQIKPISDLRQAKVESLGMVMNELIETANKIQDFSLIMKAMLDDLEQKPEPIEETEQDEDGSTT